MPDFGTRWKLVDKEPLGGGGQGNVFLVSDNQNPGPRCAAKVLKGAELTDQSPRWKRLEEEIEISKSFNHPNVIGVIDSGHTGGSGYPFFVMPHYSDGSLQKAPPKSDSPAALFHLFAGICDGVAHIHSKNVVHRDIKPANIFLHAGRAVVGDLGLCFRFDAESLTETMEVATARWFGAPELRDGHLEHPLPCADVYSLGKLLYWLFTGRVYDRDEQVYGAEECKLSHVMSQRGIDMGKGAIDDRAIHAGAFVDEIIAQTVRYRPADRTQTAMELASNVRAAIARFASGGHALDLSLPQRCLFCGKGNYTPIAVPPTFERRMAPPDQSVYSDNRPSVWAEMRNQTTNSIGQAFGGSGGNVPVPLTLVCDYCGHMQHFRWDRIREAHKRWRP